VSTFEDWMLAGEHECREAMAKAWDEGVEYVADGMYDTTEWLKANPYRTADETP
jgi:hypothetical protein